MRKFLPPDLIYVPSDDTFYSVEIPKLQSRLSFILQESRKGIFEEIKRQNFKLLSSQSLIALSNELAIHDPLYMFWSGDLLDDVNFLEDTSTICMDLDSIRSTDSLRTVVQERLELRSTGQQTEILCRNSNGSLTSTAQDSGTFMERPSYELHPTGRSISLLSSVYALILQSQFGAKRSVSASGEPVCRICLGGTSAECLVRPCCCRGTIAAVHRSCLERWLLQTASSHCELCRHHFIVTRTHKYCWLRSVAEWARSGRGRALAADAWRAGALCACSVLGTARALHAADAALQAGARRGGSAALLANIVSSMLIGVVGALNGLLTTWILLKIQEHQLSWQSWQGSTLHVRVVLSREVLDEETPDSIPLALENNSAVGSVHSFNATTVASDTTYLHSVQSLTVNTANSSTYTDVSDNWESSNLRGRQSH